MFNNFKKIAYTVAICAGVGLSAGAAQAAPVYSSGSISCSNSLYGSGGSITSTYGTYTNCGTNHTANSASTVVTATAVLKSAATQTAGLVNNRVSAALGGGVGGVSLASNEFSAQTGMAAGNHHHKVGAWVSGTYSDIEDENTDTAFDGEVYNVMGGLDYRVAKNAVIGVSVGYEDSDIDTEYNGFGGNDGNLDGDGFTVAPYVGIKLTDKVSFTLSGGYSDLEYDTLRYDPNSGNQIVGNTDAERYFVSGSLAGSHMFKNNWRLSGVTSIFYVNEERDAFTETESNGTTIAVADQDTELGQILVDARLGYVYKHVEPYALAGVQFDYTKDEAPVATGQSQSSLDSEDFGAKFGGGLNFRLSPQVTGSLEGYTVEFRDDYNEYTFSGGLRVQF